MEDIFCVIRLNEVSDGVFDWPIILKLFSVVSVGVGRIFFHGGEKVAKFDFTHSKPRKRPFFAKNLTGNVVFQGGKVPPFDAHGCEIQLQKVCQSLTESSALLKIYLNV